MAQNDFIPFCPTDTGTNLLTESEYAAATDRTTGNQPGVASSKLVNKALRQPSYIASQLAQLLADQTGEDILDDNTPNKLLAQLNASLRIFPPVFSAFTSGTGTFNPTYIFLIASGSASSGATYTNNSVTFTVVGTIATGTVLKATGAGAPLGSGTLTKASGTGDSTITFYAVRAPLYIEIEMVGGGGGGAGSGTAGAHVGGSGGDTTLASTLLFAGGGVGGQIPNSQSTGGTVSNTGGTILAAIAGAIGTSGQEGGAGIPGLGGGGGGSSPFGGGAGGGSFAAGGTAAAVNSGAGGGGAGLGNATGDSSGGGGSSGGYIKAVLTGPYTTYPYNIGVAGSGGLNGTNGQTGGDGGSGIINIKQNYQ